MADSNESTETRYDGKGASLVPWLGIMKAMQAVSGAVRRMAFQNVAGTSTLPLASVPCEARPGPQTT